MSQQSPAEHELAQLLVESLNLEDVAPESIDWRRPFAIKVPQSSAKWPIASKWNNSSTSTRTNISISISIMYSPFCRLNHRSRLHLRLHRQSLWRPFWMTFCWSMAAG